MPTRFILSAAVILSLCLALTACPKSAPPPPVVLKLAIMRDGSITLDGLRTPLEDLDARFKELAEKKGTVYYYREIGAEEPHPNAIKVIETLKKHQLPVSLSSKPDYSDYVTPDGQFHPRQ